MLLFRSFRDDLVERLQDSSASLFDGCGKSKEDVLADNDLIDQMWGVYQKDIEDYDIPAPDAFRDTLEEVLHIPATD